MQRNEVMDNLIIGSTAQLSLYFPEDYIRIFSRDIDYGFIQSRRWRNIFICFAEQRTFLNGNDHIFFDVNYSKTIEVVNAVKDYCKRIYYYSTTYLWNACEGPIDLSMPFHYHETPYIKSKEQITTYLMEQVANAVVLFPCNFNSVWRRKGFLFQKIFDSIIHKRRVSIGDTYFSREMVHPRYVVKESLGAETHKMIGAGYAINVNRFIRALYDAFDLDYEEYVTETEPEKRNLKKPPPYYTKKDSTDYTEEDLLRDTVNELMEFTS